MWEGKAFLGGLLASLLGGALSGAILLASTNTVLSRIGLRSGDLSARIDDLCRDIERYADAGVRIWGAPALELGREGTRLRAEIYGLQRRIELWLDLLDRESWLFRFGAGAD